MNTSDLDIIFSTVSSEDSARKIANTLLQEKLAACVNILPQVLSVYEWKEKILEERESLMIIKTHSSLTPVLKKRISEIHPYEVPEFVVVNTKEVARNYFSWVCSSLGIKTGN